MTQTPTAAPAAAPPVSGEVYAQIQQFYAEHMQLLDAGEAEAWADGFTEDAVFAQNVKPEPWHGRETIARSIRRGVDRLAERGVVRRHWFGMVTASPAPVGEGQDGGERVRTRYYAVVFETPQGGKASLYLSTTGEDVLVRRDGRWLIEHRLVEHDGT